MFVFPSMLVSAAEKADIKIPKNLDKYNASKFPHWYVFCAMQLGAPMPYPSVHFDNAKVIAQISKKEIKTINYNGILKRGFKIGLSYIGR